MAPFVNVRTPAVGALRDVLARLTDAGFAPALGGSALLAHLGVLESGEVHDWDITVDVPAREAWSAIRDLEPRYAGSSGIHADEKLMLPPHGVEIICGFAFHTGGGIVRIPTRVSQVVDAIPFATPEGWLVAYTLLGRERQAAALRSWLERHGANREIVVALLGQPLDPEVAELLRGLPHRVA